MEDTTSEFSGSREVWTGGESSSTIIANYSLETLTYYPYEDDDEDKPLQLNIHSAATTVGGNIVSNDFDMTGIMIWAASHLLCQYCSCSTSTLGKYVIELGCGCGLVGIAAMKSPHRPLPDLWVSTDIDPVALSICRKNFAINNSRIQNNNAAADAEKTQKANEKSSPFGEDKNTVWVESLPWGDDDKINKILNKLQGYANAKATANNSNSNNNKEKTSSCTKFDSVVAADIVYPSTCGETLKNMFRTVDLLLQPTGTFYLSFATRDGPKTPMKLVQTASQAGFAIDCLPPLRASVAKRLPPLLDSKILVMKRSSNASKWNESLGAEDCHVFPRLRASWARLFEDPSSSEEEWEAPIGVIDSEDDEGES